MWPLVLLVLFQMASAPMVALVAPRALAQLHAPTHEQFIWLSKPQQALAVAGVSALAYPAAYVAGTVVGYVWLPAAWLVLLFCSLMSNEKTRPLLEQALQNSHCCFVQALKQCPLLMSDARLQERRQTQLASSAAPVVIDDNDEM